MRWQNARGVLAGAILFGLIPARGEKMYVYPLLKQPIRMALCAVDEWGKPLVGESVAIFPFREDKLFAKFGKLKGATDTNGCFWVRGIPAGPWCHCYFGPETDDYYRSSLDIGNVKLFDGLVVTGVVRKVGNPIKMKNSLLSVSGKEGLSVFGIDLMKGELMPPAGNGSVTDAVLRVGTELRGNADGGQNEPIRVSVELEMVDKQGGFVNAPYYRCCDFGATREAPADGMYAPVLSFSADIDDNVSIRKDLANCESENRHAIFKVVRASMKDGGVKHALYGMGVMLQFQAHKYAPGKCSWDFLMPLSVNGRPDDRNLERVGRQSDAWHEANYERIMAEPAPESWQ